MKRIVDRCDVDLEASDRDALAEALHDSLLRYPDGSLHEVLAIQADTVLTCTYEAPALPDPAERATLSVEEAAEILGVGRTAAYAAAREYLRTGGASGIPAIRIGRSLRVPTAALRRLLMVDPDQTD